MRFQEIKKIMKENKIKREHIPFSCLSPPLKPLPHWTGAARLYKQPRSQVFYKKRLLAMIDLTTRNIQRLFERQVRELTRKTIMSKEDTFDYQLSGGWLQ